MKRWGAAPTVTFEGKWHRLPDAGINPPLQRKKSAVVRRSHGRDRWQRIAKWATAG